MEPIEGSETSAIINQTPGNYPKGNLLYSVHGESLKSRRLMFAAPYRKICIKQLNKTFYGSDFIYTCCSVLQQFIWFTWTENTNSLSEYQFVDIPREHGASWQDAGIRRRHDCCRYSAQTKKWHETWRKVLQHHRQDHAALFGCQRVHSFVVCFVPRWNILHLFS